jgi:hypothetical protein
VDTGEEPECLEDVREWGWGGGSVWDVFSRQKKNRRFLRREAADS